MPEPFIKHGCDLKAPTVELFHLFEGVRIRLCGKSSTFYTGIRLFCLIFTYLFRHWVIIAPKMYFWLSFRLLQAFRLLRAAGFPWLALLLIVTAALWATPLYYWSGVNPWYAALLGGVATGLVHGYRSDAQLLSQGEAPARMYYAIDYTLLAGVLGVLPLARGNWEAALSVCCGLVWAVLPAGMLQRRGARKRGIAMPFIPTLAIEWLYLLRTMPVAIAPAVLLALATLWRPEFYLAALGLGLALLPAGFEYLEPFAMLPTCRRDFYRRWRAGAGILYYWLIPTWLLLLYARPSWWALGLYLILAYETVWALGFFYRYAAWSPGRRRLYGGTVLSIGIVFALLPGGLAVSLALAAWYYKKALLKLHTYAPHT